MKILITGGHLTPALAFIDYIQENYYKDIIVFVGRTHTRKDSKQQSREQIETHKRKIEFITFESVKLSRNSFFEKLKTIPLLLISTIKSIYIVGKVKPSVFISFGGYLAVPITFASWIMRIPIITHEQTRTAGVANKLIAKFAKKVAISYKESRQYFPKGKTLLTGNLIRKNILSNNNTQPKWIKSTSKFPILYITGGSQGSEIINHTISQIIGTITKDWLVIHQCGSATKTRNYKKELDKIRNKLSIDQRNNYYAREWLDENDLSWVYSNTKAIISRSGANTTEEIASRGIPSVLIPLPFSHNDEQLKNAQALSNKKQAILLEQKFLSPETMIESIYLINKFNRKFTKNLKLFSQFKNSEKKLYDLLKKVVKK